MAERTDNGGPPVGAGGGRQLLYLLPLYALLAVVWTWPAILSPIRAVPGAERTDLWDSLWSFWYVKERLLAGSLPIRVDGLLNHPEGGLLSVADPLNALLMLPLQLLMPLPAAWTALVMAHIVFSGLASFALCRRLSGSVWAGLAGSLIYAGSPVLLAHIHNGASEAVGGGWLALAAWAFVRLEGAPDAPEPGWRAAALAGALFFLCAMGQWYAGLCAGLLLGSLLAGWLARGDRGAARRGLLAGCLGLALTLPVAGWSAWAATAPDNLVGIKDARELRSVRRTIGAADPEGFFHPGAWYSPDFRTISRYGEQYIHCSYLGWVGIGVGLWGLLSADRRRGSGPWWLALTVGLAFATGPVLVAGGEPVILPGRRAIPLPWLLVEGLPGFASLSLLWRLTQLGALGLAATAAMALRGSRPAAAIAVGLAALLETALISPMAGALRFTDGTPGPLLLALREAPEGAVMNFPLVGGRPYLFEQTVHGKPIAGTLNFPNNRASMQVWKAILDAKNKGMSSDDLRQHIAAAARKAGVRYLVVHVDPMARPDMHDAAVRLVKEAYTPIHDQGDMRLYALW